MGGESVRLRSQRHDYNRQIELQLHGLANRPPAHQPAARCTRHDRDLAANDTRAGCAAELARAHLTR